MSMSAFILLPVLPGGTRVWYALTPSSLARQTFGETTYDDVHLGDRIELQ